VPDPRRNPFDGVTDYISELSRMRTLGIHGEGSHSQQSAERTHASAWVPTTEILSRGDDLIIRVELAGVDPDDVDLRFSHGVLTVSGTRKSGYEDEEVEHYVQERYYGEFRRLITLPDATDASQIEAEFDDGLVTITVRNAVAGERSTKISLANRSEGAVSRKVADAD
jgi:HSP20 family protein